MFTNGNIHFIIPHVNTGDIDLKSKKEKRKKKKSKRQKKDNEVNIY